MPKKRSTPPTPAQQLARLPQRADFTLMGGLLPLDMSEFSGPGMPRRPMLALWVDADSGQVFGATAVDLDESADDGRSEAVAVLMESLLAGGPTLPPELRGDNPAMPPAPARPARFIVTDPSLALALRGIFSALNTAIDTRSKLPALEEARDQFVAFVQSSLAGEPVTWGIAKPTATRLFNAADALLNRDPWQLIGDYPPVVIDLGDQGPEASVTSLYASILDMPNDQRGVVCYYHLADLQRLIIQPDQIAIAPEQQATLLASLRSAGIPIDSVPPAMRDQIVQQAITLMPDLVEGDFDAGDTIACLFHPRDQIETTYVDWIRARRLKTSGESIPIFVRTLAGGEHRDPNERESLALAVALEALAAFFDAHHDALASLDPPPPGVPLTLQTMVGKGKARAPVTLSYTPDDSDSLPDHPPSPAAATTLYRFKVALDWQPDVWRTLELRGDHTLDDLHLAIQRAFDWDNDHLYAFFLSGKAWDEATMYASPHDDAEQTADSVYLEDVFQRAGKKFLYIFDYGDDLRHRLTLEAILRGGVQPGTDYPRLRETHGAAPPQYPDAEDDQPE